MEVVPYILPDELLRESSGSVDFTKVYPSDSVTTEEKLLRLCREVSDTVDMICGKQVYNQSQRYVLRASETTESSITSQREKAGIDIYGNLFFIASYRPIFGVTGFGYGTIPTALDDLSEVGLSYVSTEGRIITAHGQYERFREYDLRVQVSYVNGFPNTLLDSDAAATATTITLGDATGLYAGGELEIMDDPAEGVLVSSVAGNVVTLTAPLEYDHAEGVRVTGIPRDVYRACVFLAWDTVQTHAREGLAISRLGLMGGDEITHPVNMYKLACERLQPYILTP